MDTSRAEWLSVPSLFSSYIFCLVKFTPGMEYTRSEGVDALSFRSVPATPLTGSGLSRVAAPSKDERTLLCDLVQSNCYYDSLPTWEGLALCRRPIPSIDRLYTHSLYHPMDIFTSPGATLARISRFVELPRMVMHGPYNCTQRTCCAAGTSCRARSIENKQIN